MLTPPRTAAVHVVEAGRIAPRGIAGTCCLCALLWTLVGCHSDAPSPEPVESSKQKQTAPPAAVQGDELPQLSGDPDKDLAMIFATEEAGKPGLEQVAPAADAVTQQPLLPPSPIQNSIGMQLVCVPAGEFRMGSPLYEDGRALGEQLQIVRIAEPFYIAAHEVTQEQYQQVMGSNPSARSGSELPVETVTWMDAMRFCERLGEQEGQTYRLPTEQEWEYACRAGTKTPFHYGIKLTPKHANFNWQYQYYVFNVRALPSGGTRPVGSYEPNALGLYDMHGNVWEWCLDRLPDLRDAHITRGGGWREAAQYSRSAQRWAGGRPADVLGFRVVRTLEPQSEPMAVPDAPPLDREVLHTTKELLARIDQGASQPSAQLLPAVLILPAADAEGRIRDDGIGLSFLASFDMVHGRTRRMELCLHALRISLEEAGCLQSGVIMEEEAIQQCAAMLDAQYVVSPTAAEHDGQFHLTATLRRAGDSEELATFDHAVDSQDVSLLPGLLAHSILDHFGAELMSDETELISGSKLSSAGDVAELGEFITTREFGDDDSAMLAFLERNPRCALAWMTYLQNGKPARLTLARLRRIKPPLDYDVLTLLSRTHEPASGDTLISLLKFWGSYGRTNTLHFGLTGIALQMNDPEVAVHLFEQWRHSDQRFVACLTRGRRLVEWARLGRGLLDEGNVSPIGLSEYEERVYMARRDFMQAIQTNPNGPSAHAELQELAESR